MEHLPLILQPLRKRRVLALINNLFRRPDRDPRQARNLSRNIHSPTDAFLRGIKYTGRNSPLPSLFASKVLPRQYQLHSPTLPDRPRQPLTTARAGNNAQLDLRLAECRRSRTIDDIRHERELTASAKRNAIDGSDDRFTDVRDCGGPRGDEIGIGNVAEGEVFHLFDVCTSCEGFCAACEHDGADGVVIVVFCQGVVEFGEEGRGERVKGAGAVEGD